MELIYAHLVTVVPCIFIGTLLIFMKKGTLFHKSVGKVYMLLMLITALISLFIPAQVGSQFLGHFGYLHLLSVLTVYTVPTAYWAAKQHRIKAHKRKMIILYVGAILLAGGFTLYPGRYLHGVFFGG